MEQYLKENDDADIEKSTARMYEAVVTAKESLSLTLTTTQITEVDTLFTFPQAEQQKNHHDKLRNRFLSRFGEENLSKYLTRWADEVNGFLEGKTLFEYTALCDFFEAAQFGFDNVIDRAITIGIDKKRKY